MEIEIVLTNFGMQRINLKVGEKVKKFLVCAIKSDVKDSNYSNIDGIKFCNDKNFAREQKKKLKKKFSKDNVEILEIQVKRIERKEVLMEEMINQFLGTIGQRYVGIRFISQRLAFVIYTHIQFN